MYTAEDILKRLKDRPFHPLRIVASEGLRFDIHHSDLVFVGRRDLIIGHPDPANPAVYDQTTRVALVHVVALEDLPTTPAGSNGQQGAS
jgi:hypothetical protein